MPKTNPPADVRKASSKNEVGAKGAVVNTDSGATKVSPDSGGDVHVEKMIHTESLVAAMPFNSTKPAEHGFANAIAAQPGATVTPQSRLPTASPLSEKNSTEKTGGVAPEGVNAAIEPLDQVRVDS